MNTLPFTIENLRKLMAESPAYRDLPQDKKDNIESHIKQKNKPVMLYVFQQLREESGAHQIAREKLAEKVLTISPSDLASIQNTVKTDFHNSDGSHHL